MRWAISRSRRRKPAIEVSLSRMMVSLCWIMGWSMTVTFAMEDPLSWPRLEETSPVFTRRDAEPVGDALANISEGGAESNRSGAQLWGKTKDRGLLARVVGTPEGRFVAVVGGENQQGVGAKLGDQLGQAGIEGFERRGIAGNVAAMAVF